MLRQQTPDELRALIAEFESARNKVATLRINERDEQQVRIRDMSLRWLQNRRDSYARQLDRAGATLPS